MLVRCGRCRAELEIPGPGEFVCPACGTRNAVRGGAPSPFDLPTVGGGPGPFQAPPPPPPTETAPGVSWVVCPSCSYRFALGDVDQVACPACSTTLRVDGESVAVHTAAEQGTTPPTANP